MGRPRAIKRLVIFAFAVSSYGATLPLNPPTSARIDVAFALPQFNREYAAQGGNPQPTAGRLVMFLPPNFDPHRVWPVLIVNSTSDGGRTSTMDAPGYRFATAEGWVVLATDATIPPRGDSTSWRAAILSAGLDVLHHDWPSSKTWPVVFAGISGGAKRSEWLAALFSPTHSLRIAGIFLAGINDDRMPDALQAFHPQQEFYNVPIWISSGRNDAIAKPEAARDVQGSLVHLGFHHVRLSSFLGAHELSRADMRDALRWFRSIGQF